MALPGFEPHPAPCYRRGMARRVLVLGSGGREHALAWALRRAPSVGELLVAPGNPGAASLAECLPGASLEPAAVVTLARERAVDLVVVGPEAPLCAGVVDALAEAGIAAFGPTRAAARLEGSKAFLKDFAERWRIPTARYAIAPRDLAAAVSPDWYLDKGARPARKAGAVKGDY